MSWSSSSDGIRERRRRTLGESAASVEDGSAADKATADKEPPRVLRVSRGEFTFSSLPPAAPAAAAAMAAALSLLSRDLRNLRITIGEYCCWKNNAR